MTVMQPPRDLDDRATGPAAPEGAAAAGPPGAPPPAGSRLIDGFLCAAFDDGIVDDATFHALEAFLAAQPLSRPATASTTASASGAAAPPAPPPGTAAPPAPPPAAPALGAHLPKARAVGPQRPIWETVPTRRGGAPSRTRGTSISTPTPSTPVQPTPPTGADPTSTPSPRPGVGLPAEMAPAEPGLVATTVRAAARRSAALARAVAADVALHGFVYLGLLLTFVGLLGFLLFSFKDVPTDAQPIIELAVPVVLFSWSWFLRRQRALRVAQAMELLGGIVLPLVVFAALVDGAPVPPDAQGGALVVAMVVVCVTGAALYAGWSRAHADSMLRFLVHPMLWLGAMALGFVGKTDEPLLGDAITRLVSLQPALAAVAVAASLAWVQLRPGGRLVVPTRLAALPGILAAYGLTVGLAVGEGWTELWPVALAGAAALTSAELLATQHDRRAVLAVFRPLLLAVTIAPLVPILGVAWAGVVAVAAYVGVAELALRETAASRAGLAVAAAGVAVGAAMATSEPWTAVLAWAAITLWTTARLALGTTDATLTRPIAIVAAVAPIGLAWSLLVALPVDVAWLVVAGSLLASAIAMRWRGDGRAVWSHWSAGAAAVVAAGVVVSWDVLGAADLSPTLLALAALFAATVVALGRGWPVGRLWATSAILAVALALFLLDLPLAATARPVVWTAAGLAAVAIAALRRWPPSPHLAAVGHLLAVVALVMAAEEQVSPLSPGAKVLALALVGSALGWFVAVVAQEVGAPNVADVLWPPTPADVAAGAGSRVARSVPAALLLVSLPFAWLTSLAQLPGLVDRPAWVGGALATLALAEAGAARLTAGRPSLRPVVAPAAALLAVGAVAAGVADRDVLLLTAAVAIAITGVLGRRLVPAPYAWFAWLQSGLVLLLLADRAGLRTVLLPTVIVLWGASLLLAGLAVDDGLAGRRAAGAWVRRPWLRAPVVLGAAGVVGAYGLMAAQAAVGFDVAAPTRLGWWSLVLAGVTLVVALQLRLAPLSGVAALLATVGLALLSPWPVTAHPWVLVGLAGVLVAVAWVLERGQPPTAALARRWDLPSLVAAHLVVATALVRAAPAGAVAATWLAAGVLAAAVAAWRRRRAWAEASNVLLVVGASALGEGWLALAFLGTAVRGIVGASRTDGGVRSSYHGIGVVGAGAGWLTLAAWLDWSAPAAIVWSAVGFGLLAVGVAVLLRIRWLRPDTAASWAGLAIAAEIVTLVALATVVGDIRPVGLAPAVGVALLALGATVAAPVVSSRLHEVAAGLVIVAWLLAIAGAGWDVEAASMVTAGTFAVVALVTVEVVRRRCVVSEQGRSAPALPRRLARTWFGTAAVGVALGAVLAIGAIERRPVLLVLAGALLVVAAAAARGPDVLAWPALRYLSGLLVVASVIVAAVAFEVPIDGLALLVLGLGLAATLAALAVWRTVPTATWLRPLVTAGLAASLFAALFAVAEPRDLVLAVVLVAYAGQSAAIGLVVRRPGVLALAPAFAVAGWFVLLFGLPYGGVVWITIPIAVALLAEVDVARWWRRQQEQQPTSRELLVLEVAAIGLLTFPPLTELFATGLAIAVVAVALAAALLLWAVVTRVRRRAVAAAALATATAVLTIAAAAAGQAPTSAFVWIVTGGVGVALLLVVALVEATRSRGGRRLQRLDELTAAWE